MMSCIDAANTDKLPIKVFLLRLDDVLNAFIDEFEITIGDEDL